MSAYSPLCSGSTWEGAAQAASRPEALWLHKLCLARFLQLLQQEHMTRHMTYISFAWAMRALVLGDLLNGGPASFVLSVLRDPDIPHIHVHESMGFPPCFGLLPAGVCFTERRAAAAACQECSFHRRRRVGAGQPSSSILKPSCRRTPEPNKK